jgi:opacity protein-like surface antigen
MKMKLLVAAAATVVASSAMAQSAFEGAYAQLGVGYGSSTPGIKSGVITSGGLAGQTLSSSGGNGSSFEANIGAGYYFGITQSFLLGVGAEYSPLPSSKSTTQILANGVSQDALTGNKTSSYALFVSPAIAIDKDKLAYAKLGYTSMATKGTSAADNTSQNLTWNGYTFGLGYKQIIDGGLYGFAEGNYAMYNKKGIESTTASQAPTGMNLMVGIGYKF